MYGPEVLDILAGSEMVCDRLYISKTFTGSVVLEFGLFDNSLQFKFSSRHIAEFSACTLSIVSSNKVTFLRRAWRSIPSTNQLKKALNES